MAILCSAKAAKRSGLTQALGQLEIFVRLVLLAVALFTFGCSKTLSPDECMQLRKKEMDFLTAVTPNIVDRLPAVAELVRSCPSKRSRPEYECIMAANNANQYAACNR